MSLKFKARVTQPRWLDLTNIGQQTMEACLFYHWVVYENPYALVDVWVHLCVNLPT
jgi:hypothetical protein